MSEVNVGSLIISLAVGNQLGEGIQWNANLQEIWWTDITGQALYCYKPLTQQTSKINMPERVGCFAFIENDERLLIAFASGIAFYQLKTKEINWLFKLNENDNGTRFNDGRVDRFGHFWAGTMVENEGDGSKRASLYRLNARQQCEKVLEKIQVSNGLCFSLDGKTLYHADSPESQIMSYQWHEKSQKISHAKHIATTAPGSFPDGSCIDNAGYLWNAQWGGQRVVRYAPNGSVDLIHEVPVTQPSCVAIGGPNMDWLIITSAKQGVDTAALAQDEQAGDVFIYQLHGVKGVIENQYKLEQDLPMARN